MISNNPEGETLPIAKSNLKKGLASNERSDKKAFVLVCNEYSCILSAVSMSLSYSENERDGKGDYASEGKGSDS